MTSTPEATLSNRLGKTAVFVHLGGIVMAGLPLCAVALAVLKSDEVFTVGCGSTILFIVMAGWSFVLGIRAFFHKENFGPIFILMLLGALEVSILIIGACYLSTLNQFSGGDPFTFINKWALPIFIPIGLFCLLLAIALSYPRPSPKEASPAWKWRRCMAAFFISILIILPYPLLRYSVKMNCARWQGELGIQLFCNFPNSFEYFGPVETFMPKYLDTDTDMTRALSHTKKTEIYLIIAKEGNSKTKLAACSYLENHSFEPNALNDIFIGFSQDSDPTVRFCSFQIFYTYEESSQPTYVEPQWTPALARAMLAMTQDSDLRIALPSAFYLGVFLKVPFAHIRNPRRYNWYAGRRAFNGPKTTEETEEINLIREKTEAWLKEHP